MASLPRLVSANGVSVVDLMRTTPKRIRTMNANALAAP